jgi:hypothetical protein
MGGRSFSEYSLDDWKRLRPITEGIKTVRYHIVDSLYRRRAARSGDLAAIARTLRDRNVLFTIAFEDPEAIAWQAALVRHFVPSALHVIVDNSLDDAAAAGIERTCRDGGVAYLRTPHNPWPAPSRSHGIALNWVWHNLVRPGRPRAFGFLDDDLFPTAPDDPFEPLSRQDVYGFVRHGMQAGSGRWFLWAGFCTIRFDKVQSLALDFGQDWFLGLDTGGGNWRSLYRHLDLAALEQAPAREVPYRDGVETRQGPFQWIGTWLHEVGQMGQPELMADKRRVLSTLLAPPLEAAGRPRGGR